MENRDEILEALAYWVHYFREKQKLSQLELAVRVGVDTRQIGRIEQQVNAPSIVLVYRIAKALDVTLNQLVQPMEPEQTPEQTIK
uniref:Helix-turn-helix transcriptional regulator n=1 Tax=Roseihalotalea indica TaxID=2867963 RepID=A0AA49GQL8_9BACT|nr:helix-turn-helix transcriptional regulator [Tunicatimonas sp. TK19036]